MAGTIRNWRIIDGQIYGDLVRNDQEPTVPICTSLVHRIMVATVNSVYYLDPLTEQPIELKRYVGKTEG